MSTIDTTLGVLELSAMLMMLLYGIMIAQAYTYYKSSYSGDNRTIHVLVSWRRIAFPLSRLTIYDSPVQIPVVMYRRYWRRTPFKKATVD